MEDLIKKIETPFLIDCFLSINKNIVNIYVNLSCLFFDPKSRYAGYLCSKM